MGKNIIFVNEKEVLSVEHTEESLSRKFKKRDRVKTLCLCDQRERDHQRCEIFQSKFGKSLPHCPHCTFCNKIGIVEDTEEAGSNWKGMPKYGLRYASPDKKWLGDFLEDEIEMDKG